MSAIYTYGHQGHSIEEFLHEIDERQIHLVIDVRETPLCKENPSFSKFPLISSLREHHVEYLYVKALGCTEEIRQLQQEELGMLKYFQRYERHLQQHRNIIQDIAHQTKEMNLCILCAEPDPETCHRTLVADYLHIENYEAHLEHLH